MYIANVNEDGFENNPYLDKVREFAEKEGSVVVLYARRLKQKLLSLMMMKKLNFLQDLGIEEPGLNRVIRAGYALLNLQTYFTAGVKEVRAWTVSVGATAPKAAAVIHTDFEKGFIRAEVIAYDDFIQFKGENGAKEAGKWRLEGKDTSSKMVMSCTSALTYKNTSDRITMRSFCIYKRKTQCQIN